MKAAHPQIFRMSWLSDLVKDAASNRDPVTISQDPDGDGVFIRGRGFGMEFPEAVKLGLTKVTDMLRAKDMPLAPREFQNGVVCYIPVPGCPGVVVVQPQARATRFLKRLHVHEDGCEENDGDEDEADCECSGPFRLSTRLNTEDRLTVVDRPGKSSVYVPVKPPKNCVELETACAICLTPENVETLLYIFESDPDCEPDGGVKGNKRKAEADGEDCDAKKQKC